ncbi:FtsJ-like methyltransferase-domain-containing protein [Sporodiniella umbellata]|nr:FtsJ-like methyltransferase-domain-containing protein [Sporodiniella umbellata]
MSVGLDHIDLAETKSRGISVGYTPDVLTNATADLTLLLALGAGRRMKEALQVAENGQWREWRPTWMCGCQPAHKTIGIVGMGRIGQAVAKRLRAFDISRLVYSGRTKKDIDGDYVSFDELLKVSDFVIIFVNSARGGIVDQEALVKALEEKLIGAAGLDVTDPEPLPPTHRLYSFPNCIVLPHIGSATMETREQMARTSLNNVLAGLNDQPLPFSLIQIHDKYRLIRSNDIVIDCGAAPGGWSQVAAEKGAQVISVDLLPMDPLPQVHFIQGNFLKPSVQRAVHEQMNHQKAHLVCSDMAPSFSGHHIADHARSMELCESALVFAEKVLSPGGSFVAKFLMGGTEMEFRKKLQTLFRKVKVEKPDASRKQSTEGFFVALGYRPTQNSLNHQ